MFNFIAFIRTKWAEYSEFSGQQGTPIDELAVKPTGLVMSDFQNVLVSQRRVNNLAQWETMSDDELTRFGNKFFMPREDGGYSTGYVRIYKNEREDILISDTFTAISADSRRFVATDTGTISSSAFKVSDNRYALYYIDLPVRASQQGDLYNIDAGEITSLENAGFDYVTALNTEPMTNGARAETNEEYFNRLLYTLHDGSMMNRRSTYAMLKVLFPLVTRIHIAGADDKYMQRDLVTGRMLFEEDKLSDFLGKIPGDTTIKNIAYWGNFPPQAGSEKAEIYGPFSAYSDYSYPLTIEPYDDAEFTADEDPALHGYPLNQEADATQYNGMYFDDFSRGMEVTTTDLFNIFDEEVGFTDIVVPSSEWGYGANGFGIGDFSQLLDLELKSTDLIRFNDNTITLGAGATNPISASKDIKKRAGVKTTGSFIIPNISSTDAHAYDSSFQIMVGGIDDAGIVDAFTGVGFGISIFQAFVLGADPNKYNANVYFAHSERYASAQVYAFEDDDSTHNFGDVTALKVTPFWIEPGQEYEFEFVIDDSLLLTLYLNKVTNRESNAADTLSDFETSKMMNVYGEGYLDADSTRYGTRMKVTLDTGALPVNEWQIINLKVFDMASKRANALLVFNVDRMESPLDVLFRGAGSGAVNNVVAEGYSTYIWDLEKHTVASGATPLTSGGWTELENLSNADGSADSVSSVLTQTINSIERYAIDSRFGKAIFLLVTTTGTSLGKSVYNGNIGDDIQSEILIDYAAIKNTESDSYHAKNKADVHVVTEKNTENFETSTVVLSKASGATFFVIDKTVADMPIAEIVSVSLSDAITGEVTQVMADTDYSVIRDSQVYFNSIDEEIQIYLINDNADDITVELRAYKDVDKIQDFYSDSQYAKIFGDVLVKHKMPVMLDFSLTFTGTGTEQEVADEIRTWLDENIDGVFSVREMVNRLYTSGFATGIQQPVTISYTAMDDEFHIVTGTFTDTYEARTIDFFKIENIDVQKS